MISPIQVQAHMRSLEGPAATPQPIPAPAIPGQEAVTPGASFSDTLAESLDKVNRQMVDSDKMVTDLATGQSSNIHGTMIAMQKADISFRAVLEVRNKVLSAYNEIMRMQV
jgi:flagellar hook-basal body complex protein FliE